MYMMYIHSFKIWTYLFIKPSSEQVQNRTSKHTQRMRTNSLAQSTHTFIYVGNVHGRKWDRFVNSSICNGHCNL